MGSPAHPTPAQPTDADTAELMAHYGISHSRADRFHYRHCCYSKLKDALSQARRDQPAPGLLI